MNQATSTQCLLPPNPDYDEACRICDTWRLNDWQAFHDIIIHRHNLPVIQMRQNFDGSYPIFEFELGDGRWLIVKILAPNWRAQFEAECLSLQAVANKELELRVPQLLFWGEVSNWHYLIMEKLPGIILADIFVTLSKEQKLTIVSALGRFSRKLHELPTEGLGELALDWPQFLARQRENCHARRQRQGLCQPLLDDLLPYLDQIQATQVVQKEALIHTDLHPGNLLVSECDGQLHLSGIIDFGDALVCPEPLFEFTSVGMLYALGDADLFHAYLDSYRYTGERDTGFQQKLMQLSLLRHTGDLNYLLDTVPFCRGAIHWQALEHKFFPL